MTTSTLPTAQPATTGQLAAPVLTLNARLPELDGLRGISVLAVFLFHDRALLAGTPLVAAARWGWVGVSVFFVMSGYLISTIVERTIFRPADLLTFYGRRARRILPVYFTVAALCFLGPAWMVPHALTARARVLAALSLLFFVQNLGPAKFGGTLEPTWSLAIEEQFYLLWAPLLGLLRRSPWQFAGPAAAILLSPALRVWLWPHLNPTNTLLHLDALAWGSLLGMLLHRHPAGIARCRSVAWALVGIGLLWQCVLARNGAFQDAAVGAACTGLVLLTLTVSGSSGAVARLLRSRILLLYGRISFSLYLIQIGIFQCLGFVHTATHQLTRISEPWPNLLELLLQLLVATIVATALRVWVEEPFLQRRHAPR